MAQKFEPVRMTHPQGKGPDLVAYTPAEFTSLRYRDGYVESKDQRPLDAVTADSPVVDDVTVGETAVVESTPQPAEPSAKRGAGKATDADGRTVATK